MLDDALAAIRRGDDAAARRALIAAWRARRAASLAELVALIDERSPDDIPGQLREIVRPKVVHSEARLREVAELDDPRVSAWAIDALANPPFESKTAETFLTMIVAIAERDPRLRERRHDIVPALVARIGSLPMRNRLVEAVEAAVRALPAETAPSRAEAAVEAEIARLLEPLRERARSEAALLADVYANPDDDGPRIVYADMLVERGDPRGELIHLQLARGRGGTIGDRERWLLKTRGKELLGPLAPVLSFGPGYAGTRLERGFVATADFLGTGANSDAAMRRRIALVIDSPAWATVEMLESSQWIEVLLPRSPLRALRRVARTLSPSTIFTLAERVEPLARFDTLDIRSDDIAVDVLAPALVRRAFPALATIVVHHLGTDAVVGASRIAGLARYDVRRIVIDRYPTSDATTRAMLLSHHQELISTLIGTPAPVAELAIQLPWPTWPKPDPVELRRGPDGRFVPAP